MKQTKVLLGLAVAALMLSGCAVVPLDGPYAAHPHGYRDQRVRADRGRLHPPAYRPHRWYRPYAYGPHGHRDPRW
ncbi:MAG: hypothetical protein ACE147_19135 [Candidatus Methylomirabilales bacterium]